MTSYALRVRGHSMIDDQIQDGDIIVIEQRQTAENGETVVVCPVCWRCADPAARYRPARAGRGVLRR